METLVLQYTIRNDETVRLVARLQSNGGRAEILGDYPALCDQQALTAKGKQVIEVLNRARGTMGLCATEADLGAARSLLQGEFQDCCRELRLLLLPPELALRLAGNPALTHLVFECDPLLNGLSFDCMFLGDDFAGLKYATGKSLLSPRGLSRGVAQNGLTPPYRCFNLIDPGGQFSDNSVGEWETFLAERLRRGPESKIDLRQCSISREVEADEVARIFRNYTFVNLICHHHYDRLNPNESGLSLAPGVVFSAARLLTELKAGDLPPSLVFSLSCESGITEGWEKEWPQGTRLYGMVDAARQTGVRHYIGSIIEIPSHRSVRVLRRFYDALEDGYSVGEALRQGRMALRVKAQDPWDGGTVLGLSFLLYGNPTAAYLCAAGHGVGNPGALLCEAAVAPGKLCLRGICPEDGGYATRLCARHWQAPKRQCSAGHWAAPSDVRPCEFEDGCRHTLCPHCPGYHLGLCWMHCCHDGHPIIADVRKTCPGSAGSHAEEKRSVCPLDAGFHRGLCPDCLNKLE